MSVAKKMGQLPVGVDLQAVRAQCDRITRSPDFDLSLRTQAFLRFIVDETLVGRTGGISQHAIAGTVFGRGDEFDPSADPIVRMQAGRVRKSLEHYYLTTGAADPLLIELPKGAYVPSFRLRAPAPDVVPAAAGARDDADAWPALLVSSFRNLTGRPENDFVALGLASDLAAELGRYADIHVFLASPTETEGPAPCPARFELTGDVSSHGDELKINVHLIDRTTRRQTWAHAYRCEAGPGLDMALDDLVQSSVATVAEEQGVLHAHLAEEAGRRPSRRTGSYQAILRYHFFDAVKTEPAFTEAFSALDRAVKDDPDCALCWSYFAGLGATHYGIGMPGDVIPIEETLAAARRGVELCPGDLRCRLLLGYVHLLNDQIEQARCETEMALSLGRGSIYWLDVIGYLLCLTGDWDRGPALVRKAVGMNPYHRRACHGALWLDALRRNEPLAAAAEAREYTPITNFWHPLMRASAAAAGNDMHEAISQGRRLLELRPDFPEQGRWLITRYIKSSELVETLVRTLVSAGVELADSPEEACVERLARIIHES